MNLSLLLGLADVTVGHNTLIWGGFIVFVILMLLLDLLVFHKHAHEIKFKEAVGWSVFWIALGLAFSVVVYYEYDYRHRADPTAQVDDGPHTLSETLHAVEKQVATDLAKNEQPAAAPSTPGTTVMPTEGSAPTDDLAAKPTTDAGAVAATETKISEPKVSKTDRLKPVSAWDAVGKYITGYLIEKALSVDNLFVILAIFGYFKIPAAYQHRILFWGILGALVFRAIFIFAGVALLHKFHWLIYVFGAFLLFTGLKMAFSKEDSDEDLSKNFAIRMVRKFLPVTPSLHGQSFFVRADQSEVDLAARTPGLKPIQLGALVATPLFVSLIVVELTDVIFAVDSIPAILAITTDPFIVFTSNVFAILGLRALFFALAGFMKIFHYLKYGLAIILVFIGGKMVMIDIVPIPTLVSLLITAGILIGSVLLSLVFPDRKDDAQTPA